MAGPRNSGKEERRKIGETCCLRVIVLAVRIGNVAEEQCVRG